MEQQHKPSRVVAALAAVLGVVMVARGVAKLLVLFLMIFRRNQSRAIRLMGGA